MNADRRGWLVFIHHSSLLYALHSVFCTSLFLIQLSSFLIPPRSLLCTLYFALCTSSFRYLAAVGERVYNTVHTN